MAKRPPARPRAAPATLRSSSRWIWVGGAIVVVIIAVVAILVSGGGSTTKVATGIEETRPVGVTGSPLAAEVDSGTDPAFGAKAPELHGASFDGTLVAVTNDGRPKLLIFAAHWCPHCQREIPILAEHLASVGLPTDVDIVLVATSTDANHPNYPPSSWLTKVGWKTTVLADDAQGTAGHAYGLVYFPYFVAVDRAGNVAGRTSGEISTDAFDHLLSQARTVG